MTSWDLSISITYTVPMLSWDLRPKGLKEMLIWVKCLGDIIWISVIKLKKSMLRRINMSKLKQTWYIFLYDDHYMALKYLSQVFFFFFLNDWSWMEPKPYWASSCMWIMGPSHVDSSQEIQRQKVAWSPLFYLWPVLLGNCQPYFFNFLFLWKSLFFISPHPELLQSVEVSRRLWVVWYSSFWNLLRCGPLCLIVIL